jgi:hypothetical protein
MGDFSTLLMTPRCTHFTITGFASLLLTVVENKPLLL